MVLLDQCLDLLRIGAADSARTGLVGEAADVNTSLLLKGLRSALEGREQAGREAARKACRRIHRAVGAEEFVSLVEEALSNDVGGKRILMKAVAKAAVPRPTGGVPSFRDRMKEFAASRRGNL